MGGGPSTALGQGVSGSSLVAAGEELTAPRFGSVLVSADSGCDGPPFPLSWEFLLTLAVCSETITHPQNQAKQPFVSKQQINYLPNCAERSFRVI